VSVGPDISVVLATHDRPERLRRALAALRAQGLHDDHYEIVVVDDGSGEETGELLRAEQARAAGPRLTVLRQEPAEGPAGWLEALIEISAAHPGAIVQGPTTANPDERDGYGPFSHTLENDTLGRGYETANILYPRALLEQLGGFDAEAFSHAGEDTDLAWRALGRGASAAWAPDALMYHAVTHLGPRGKLRAALRWENAMLAYKRHEGLRRTRYFGVFWNRHHFEVARGVVAVLVPRRLWWLRWMLAAPYVAYLVQRRSGPLLAPYLIVYDLLEVGSCVRGSIRYRVLVI
jgi:GT2 family glycosyltransferase